MKMALGGTLAVFCFLSPAFASAPQTPICGSASASFSYEGPTVVIPTVVDSPVVATIEVSGLAPHIWDVDATTFLRHPSNGVIDMTLTSPQGTVVTLSTDNGGANGDIFFGTVWDDQANPGGQVPYTSNLGLASDTNYANGSPLFAAAPEEPLASFNGENPNGVWTLTINNDSGGVAEGVLSLWALDIVSLVESPVLSVVAVTNDTDFPISSTGAPVVTSQVNFAAPGFIQICDIEVVTQIPHAFAGDLDVTVTSPTGRVVTLTTDNGSGNDNVFSNTRWRTRVNSGGLLPYSNQAGTVTDHQYQDNVNVPELTSEESLAAFHGDIANGTWTLTVSDDANLDGGVLSGWSVVVFSCSEGDNDGDNIPNSCDGCPDDVAKTSPGACGCGVIDADQDGDGAADCVDQCALDPTKVSLGACGCGVADTDSDGDGTPNCSDQCPQNSPKTSPGLCGCQSADVDGNANGVIDCFFTQELKTRVTRSRELLGKLKAKDGKLTAAGRGAKNELKQLLADIASFVQTNQAGISVASGQDLAALHAAADKKLKRALRAPSNAAKKAAKQALDKLDAALV